ncbi:MAG: hypothetical protein WAS56_08265, partial [Saprospiraceae bacterium]
KMKLLHLLLALNIFLSSTGITIFSHICSAKGTSVEIFSPNGHCCSKKKQKKSCCNKSKQFKDQESNQLKWTAKPCCTNDVDFVQADLESTLLQAKYDIQLNYIADFLSFCQDFELIENPTSNHKTTLFALYKAPPDQGDLIPLLQSFRC